MPAASCLPGCLLHATCLLLLLLLLSNSSGRLSDFGVAASAMVPRLFGFLNELKSKSTAEAVANTTLQNESTFPCRNCTVTLASSSNGQQQGATCNSNRYPQRGSFVRFYGQAETDNLASSSCAPSSSSAAAKQQLLQLEQQQQLLQQHHHPASSNIIRHLAAYGIDLQIAVPLLL